MLTLDHTLGHTLKKPINSKTRKSLLWNPHGKRNRKKQKQYLEKRIRDRGIIREVDGGW